MTRDSASLFFRIRIAANGDREKMKRVMTGKITAKDNRSPATVTGVSFRNAESETVRFDQRRKTKKAERYRKSQEPQIGVRPGKIKFQLLPSQDSGQEQAGEVEERYPHVIVGIAVEKQIGG